MANVIYVPSTNLIGRGCLKEVGSFVEDLSFKKAFIVTDKFLHESGFVDKVAKQLTNIGWKMLFLMM